MKYGSMINLVNNEKVVVSYRYSSVRKSARLVKIVPVLNNFTATKYYRTDNNKNGYHFMISWFIIMQDSICVTG